MINTGEFTGHNPKDIFIVKDEIWKDPGVYNMQAKSLAGKFILNFKHYESVVLSENLASSPHF